MYLHTRLLLGVAAVTLCVLTASVLAPLLFVRADVSRETQASVHLARLLLELDHDVRAADGLAQARAAAARDVLGATQLRHVNIALLDPSGATIALSPSNAAPAGWLARSLASPGLQGLLTYPLDYRGTTLGTLRVSANPRSEIAEIEQRLAGELGLLALAFLATTAIISAIVRTALRPLGQVQAALAALESGALETRLPAFPLEDLAEIARRFNHCATALQEAAAARRELTRRLIEVEEAERKRLARELHDELGQSLTAIKVDAAYIAREAAGLAPKIESCARGVERLTGEVMELIRGMLARLRPYGLETVGLRATLADLVNGWQARLGERLSCSLTFRGPVDGLPADLNVTIYRLVQECLTNAVRHSRAKSLAISLTVDADGRESTGGPGRAIVSVREDGIECGPAPLPSKGIGLLGMRERVEALGGELTVRVSESGPISLTAWMPVRAPVREPTHA